MLYFLKHLLGSKDIAYRYDQLFAEVKRVKPQTIMEVGVWSGERARKMIGLASKYHPKESIHYYGFDLFETMDKDKFQKEVSKQPPSMESIKEKLSKTGAEIHLIKGDTIHSLPELEGKLPEMDFIFIDGGHSLETIANDWEYASKLMGKGSVLIFDDYWSERTDAGAKATVDAINRSEFKVEIMPVVDTFEKTAFGRLVIQLAKVTRV